MRLARAAARDGVFTIQAARLVLILGWWLLAGELVATFAEGFARVNLLGQLVTWHVDWVHLPASWGCRGRSSGSVWAWSSSPGSCESAPACAPISRDGVVPPTAPDDHAIAIHLDKLLADRA